jgi:hypothetical protein
MTVGKTCTRIVVTAHPEETMQEVAKRMALGAKEVDNECDRSTPLCHGRTPA